MRTSAIIILALFLSAGSGFAQQHAAPDFFAVPDPSFGVDKEQSLPTLYILPADVVPDSVIKVRFNMGESSGNNFGVRWRFTEVGANKALAFWEKHNGQKVHTIIGDYVSPPERGIQSTPPGDTNYIQWRDGWLKKSRMHTTIFSNEKEANIVYLALKGKP
jgi:hypothetical protein